VLSLPTGCGRAQEPFDVFFSLGAALPARRRDVPEARAPPRGAARTALHEQASRSRQEASPVEKPSGLPSSTPMTRRFSVRRGSSAPSPRPRHAGRRSPHCARAARRIATQRLGPGRRPQLAVTDERLQDGRCRRQHLHSAGGISTYCLRQLPEEPQPLDRSTDYYAYLATEGGEPFRLHCELEQLAQRPAVVRTMNRAGSHTRRGQHADGQEREERWRLIGVVPQPPSPAVSLEPAERAVVVARREPRPDHIGEALDRRPGVAAWVDRGQLIFVDEEYHRVVRSREWEEVLAVVVLPRARVGQMTGCRFSFVTRQFCEMNGNWERGPRAESLAQSAGAQRPAMATQVSIVASATRISRSASANARGRAAQNASMSGSPAISAS
jgi:hypothetical protein